MKVYELLTLNRELLKCIHSAGLRAGDYKYVDLYYEYEERINAGEKVTYIVTTLSCRYHISERQVYNIVNRLNRELFTAKSVQ